MRRGTSVSIRSRHVFAVAAAVAALVMCSNVASAQDDADAGGQPGLTPRVTGPRAPTIPEPTVELKPGEVPAIKFDTPVYNYGRIMAGTPVEFVYYFTNPGNGPLEILKVRPGCSCTLMGNYSKIIQPGETGKIPVKLETSKLSGSKTSKSIAVYTNIPGPDKEVRLTLVGDVWQGIETEPHVASFGSMTIQEAEKKPVVKVIVVNNMDEPAKIDNLQSTHPAFKPEIRVLEPGKRFELSITLNSTEKTGGISAGIQFDTGVPALPRFSVPVRARIHAPLTVAPGTIVVGAGPRSALNRKVTIANNTTEPVKISDLKCSNEAIKVKLRELRPEKLFRLEVSLPVGYSPGESGDSITFKTTCPSAPEVTIPITGSLEDDAGRGTVKMEKAE